MQAKKFIKYYFKIKHTKKTKNTKADALNKKAKL